MNAKHLTVAGPFTYENLSIFLLRGSDALDGSRFIPLDEALEQKCVTVHETGTVGQLEVENLSDSLDLYIQAGDVVKGGRQDRTLGVDFVLPAKSGRVPDLRAKRSPAACARGHPAHRKDLRIRHPRPRLQRRCASQKSRGELKDFFALAITTLRIIKIDMRSQRPLVPANCDLLHRKQSPSLSVQHRI